MRLMLLGGGNALGQALIRLGAEEDIGFLAPRPPAQGWDAASLTQLLDDNRPDVVVNLAYYYDWFQSGQPNEPAPAAQEGAGGGGAPPLSPRTGACGRAARRTL